jgi:hypothetical protein
MNKIFLLFFILVLLPVIASVISVINEVYGSIPAQASGAEDAVDQSWERND